MLQTSVLTKHQRYSADIQTHRRSCARSRERNGNRIEPYYSEYIRAYSNLTNVQVTATLRAQSESDVSYHPDEVRYNARAAGRVVVGTKDLPPGWPRQLKGPCTWEPEDLQHDTRFIHNLNQEQLSEISHAVENVKAQNLSFDAITMKAFPLPTLGPLLTRIRKEVYNEFGFGVVRGLDMNALDPNERTIVLLGLSSYIGEERGPQDKRGTMLKHIMDDERTESLKELPFHTDVTCDVSAMLTVHCSDNGGMWNVASCSTVYNTLARDRPDLIRVLAEPNWPFDTFGRDPPFYLRAPLYHEDGKVIFNFSRRLLAGHPKTGRTVGVPKLSDIQAEALDWVHFTARNHCLKLNMQEGDIRFIGNFSLLHGRDGFCDNDGVESRRHVMRLWLRNQEMAWKLPPALQLAWARVFDDPMRYREWIVEPYKKEGMWYGRGLRAECD